ncbi:hypothetical protein JCM11641_001288 [Rhodosporidiobolus odoratus]
MARGKSSRASAVKAKRALKEVDDNSDSDFDPDVEEVHEEPVSAQEEEEEEYVRPVKKKARTSSRGGGGSTKKGTKGSLKGILDLPLDILTEICAELDLPTVFHLSRLNKRFYAFLRDPSLKYIWELARETSGLPELTAPGCDVYGYANLLFGGFCKGCGKATTKVDYTLRIRSCKKCTPDFIYDLRGGEYSEELEYAVKSNQQGISYRSHQESLLEDLRVLRHLLDRFERLRYKTIAGMQWEDLLSEDDTDEEDDEGLQGASYAGYSRLGNPDAKMDFRTSCSEIRGKRLTDGGAIVTWLRAREVEKEAALQAIRDDRRQAFQVSAFSQHKLVDVAKEFSERVWETIQAPLEELLRQIEASANTAYINKESRRREQLLNQEWHILNDDTRKQKASGFFPLRPWIEFRELPAVKDLYNLSTLEQANTAGKTLDDAKPEILAGLAKARGDEEAALFESLRVAYGDAQAARSSAGAVGGAAAVPTTIGSTTAASLTAPSLAAGTTPSHSSSLLPTLADGASYSPAVIESIFARATSLVSCCQCEQLDNYPRILTHKCVPRNRWNYVPASNKYSISLRTVKAALELLELFDKDFSTPATEMERLGRGFSCVGSECSEVKAIALPWRLIVEHAASPWNHHEDYPGAYVLETEAEAIQRVFDQHVKIERFAGTRGETPPAPLGNGSRAAGESGEENAPAAGDDRADDAVGAGSV